jgi:hypothetical protein
MISNVAVYLSSIAHALPLRQAWIFKLKGSMPEGQVMPQPVILAHLSGVGGFTFKVIPLEDIELQSLQSLAVTSQQEPSMQHWPVWQSSMHLPFWSQL